MNNQVTLLEKLKALFDNEKYDEAVKLITALYAGDIAGHCFFILELLGLIVYPHDDMGFGFITMDLKQQAPKVVKSFLRLLIKVNSYLNLKYK